MTNPKGNPLWVAPALVLVAIAWASLMIPPRLTPFGTPTILALVFGAGGSIIGYALWWLGFSGVPVGDRVIGLSAFVGALALGVGFLFDHTASNMMPLFTLLTPAALTAATLGMLVSKPLPWRLARWVVLAWTMLVIAGWSGVRVDGSDGTLALQISWRGAPTAEDVFLAQLAEREPADADAPAEEPLAVDRGDWPHFRGPNQDAIYRGPIFPVDWNLHQPKTLWRRRVGPGWSSFAVIGDRLYTQEQRGEEEATVCYNGSTGEESWAATTPARFYRVESGAGPLATPTFYEGAVYSCGAEGTVMKMHAATGQVAWKRRLTDDLPRDVPPEWGFASSPLVAPLEEGAVAIVYAGNPKGQPEETAAAIAYHVDSGEPAWRAGVGDHSYCTPVLATLCGERQVLLTSNAGLESVDAATGERLWFYEWSTGEFPRIAQPVVVDDHTLVLASGYGYGAHGLRVELSEEGSWTTETLWQSRQLRPYFNDFLIHDGHLYGYDDKFLTCLDAQTGKLAWPKKTRRRTRFGCGQVLLAEKSGVLIALTEHSGELVLLRASPDGPEEVSRLQVLAGKSWNHPVLAHGRLYVRNGAEAAAYELPSLEVAAARGAKLGRPQ